MNIISTRNLTKQYKNKIVINNISLDIKEGELYGFLGRNGAGKSTFINMITGIARPSSGEYRLFKKNIDEVKQEIGVLPDYSNFYDSMTAFDHLKYFSRISKKKYDKEHLTNTLHKVV